MTVPMQMQELFELNFCKVIHIFFNKVQEKEFALLIASFLINH